MAGICRTQLSTFGKSEFNRNFTRTFYEYKRKAQDVRSDERNSKRDFIMSVLEAHPSKRDSRAYLKDFGPPSSIPTPAFPLSDSPTPTTAFISSSSSSKVEIEGKTDLANQLITQSHSHTALVKIQGPFTDRQLASIAEGMVYLKRLGLVSIIVVDNEAWADEFAHISRLEGQDKKDVIVRLREKIKHETLRISEALEEQGGVARPLIEGILCVTGAEFEDHFQPIKQSDEENEQGSPYDLNTGRDLFLDSLSPIRDAVIRGEIPVVPPLALDERCFSLCVPANKALIALSKGLVDAERGSGLRYDSEDPFLSSEIDLTPVRLMIINREGGIPSPARAGNPHLSINLEAEYDYIHSTFEWKDTHPTSLDNLQVMRDCLSELPRTASGVIVSHRSPRALIGNLITNKPAHSPSLHYSLIPPNASRHQPTIIRHGLPIRVYRSLDHLNLSKLTKLLEESFGRLLDQESYYERLKHDLEFCITAGDYQGCAIVTREYDRSKPAPPVQDRISYLDKFAVLPSLQGDGTVDFLWGALRDESFGLGLLDSLNPNIGGFQGRGAGRDLVWRSRSNNPVNKWYWERSNGFFKIPPPPGSPVGFSMFWCEAEDKAGVVRTGTGESSDQKLEAWTRAIGNIPSCWSK